MMLLSFVIPCYRSELTIENVVGEIAQTVSQRPEYDFEVICVNDCSPDNVLSVLQTLAARESRIKVIDFMRNCGRESAVLAGLSAARGEIAVVMDDDGQCPMAELWNLIEPVESGLYDVSTAKYTVKKESLFKRFCSDVNKWCAHLMLNQPKELRFENFIAVSRRVYLEMLKYKNPYPFTDGLILRVTKRIAAVPMEERSRGDSLGSGFTFMKAFGMFADGYTAFSVVPLRIATILGCLTALAGLIYMAATIVIYFVFDGSSVMGYSSLMTVLLFASGIIMMMLGLIGEYIGRIYICINQSPQYVIRQTLNLPQDETRIE